LPEKDLVVLPSVPGAVTVPAVRPPILGEIVLPMRSVCVALSASTQVTFEDDGTTETVPAAHVFDCDDPTCEREGY
jgi:hypothetical protein